MPPGPAVDLPVEPGIYSVNVEVVKESLVIFGQLKAITDLSNAASFAVIPRVTGATRSTRCNAESEWTSTGSLDLTPTDRARPVRSTCSSSPMARTTSGTTRPVPAPSTPAISSPSTACLEFRAAFDPTVPGAYPLRVIVEGAESQPFWFQVP